ncbi:hypothetical protein H6F38_14060 [Paenibacillus sp. EKM208P]|nr:hypothetical protein H6F38_14060 [Paenibacillus sp. EKM208P]
MDISKELKPTKGDIAHITAKNAIASIPVLGNLLSEAFSLLVTQPAEKRKENILIMIDQRLQQLEGNSFDMGSLANNELFLSSVLQATQIAMRTHQQDKLAALLNIVTNVATDTSIDDSIVQMYLNIIDTFNEWHLRVLLLLNNPRKYYVDKGIPTHNIVTGSPMLVLYTIYPELKSRESFTKQILNDLFQRDMISTDPFNMVAVINVDRMLSSRTTETGKHFIEFISQR